MTIYGSGDENDLYAKIKTECSYRYSIRKNTLNFIEFPKKKQQIYHVDI